MSGFKRYFSHEPYKPENRVKYLQMSIEEKRKLYKCKGNYQTLEGIQQWPELSKQLKSKVKNESSKFNPDIDIASKVSIWRGDITTLEIDSIVNAANSSLLGGGGVDGAIHSASGKLLLAECSSLKGCDTGKAKITSGYNLPAKYIIHTVGPMDQRKQDLINCYQSCLELAKENNCRTIAFPCIATGIYGYPNEEAGKVALNTVRNFLEKYKEFDRVIFCLFLKEDVEIYERLLPIYFPFDYGQSKITVDNSDNSIQKSLDSKTVNCNTNNHETSDVIEKVVVDSQIVDQKVIPQNDDGLEKDVADSQIGLQNNLDVKTELIVKPVELEDELKKGEVDGQFKQTKLENADVAKISEVDGQIEETKKQSEILVEPSKTEVSGKETKTASEQIENTKEISVIDNQTKKNEVDGQVKQTKIEIADETKKVETKEKTQIADEKEGFKKED